MKKRFKLVTALLMLISTSGCWFGTSRRLGLPSGEKGLRVKTVTELVVTPFGYPHPYHLNFVAQYRFVHQVGEFLVRRDNHQGFIGGLAHSWDISSDRRTITFHLRDNIYSAEEVAQSLRRLIRVGQTSHANFASQTTETDIRVIDRLNLEIRTHGDAGALLSPLVMADAVIIPDDSSISVPGQSELQVDWKKTRGPYIYSEGHFPAEAGKAIVFKPNPNHYLYSPEELTWRIIYQPLEGISSLNEFKAELDKTPTFFTVRYVETSKLFNQKIQNLLFYETKPNGILFLMPNPRSKLMQEREARLALAKRIIDAKINLLNPQYRAYQIAQPGLSGRMSEEELAPVLSSIRNSPDYVFESPISWNFPDGTDANQNWIASVAEAIGLPYSLKSGSSNPFDPRWVKGEYDVMIASVGMSDTDPISGASFLFSPQAANLDLKDGAILKLLNSAKGSDDRNLIVRTVRKAFKMALENALIIPISYTVNRHYYSRSVDLNVQDPFSESVKIWEVRLKN